MKRATDAGNNPAIEHLIALCLEMHEDRGPEAVETLLRAHPDSSVFVRERLDLLARMGLVGEAPRESIPRQIAGYEILGVLGRGGMGVVYEARHEPLQRNVAIKVLRTLPSSDEWLRFRHEAQLLGRLQHPGIAQVYEVGSAEVGGMRMPFFAMELVRGRALDVYAREQELSLASRVELLAKLADGVQHAHQKQVVHRDLKPANILVDERGQPRILDFGVATTVDPDLKLETLRTQSGQLLGTLAYMSPEQAAGNAESIDSRTDVYSLGVLAYELLGGGLPFSSTGLSMLEALRRIQEDPAPRLSSAKPCLRGDLETIVAKAMAKEKEQRYGSAQELSLDLRRFLRDEPISARPATALYQLRKFSRRNRVLVAGVLAFSLVLVLGLLGTLKGKLAADRERDDAERRFRETAAILGFQKRMFAAADPGQQGLRVEDLLDRGALLIQEYSDPVEHAAIQLMLGESYESIGLYHKAEPLIQTAANTFQAELGSADLQSLSAQIALASLYASKLGQRAAAEAVLSGVDELAASVHGDSHGMTLRARLMRARLEFEYDRHGDAVRIARGVLDQVREGTPLWADASHRLALSLEQLGQKEEALELAVQLRDWSLQAHGEAHPASWSAMNTYGNMLRDLGRAQEGQAVLERLLELRREHLGALHPDTINTQSNLGTTCVQLGQLERGEQLLLEVLALCEAQYRPDHPERLRTLNTLASLRMMQGRVKQAEPLLQEVLEWMRVDPGREHIHTTAVMGNLGKALGHLGETEEAEELFLEALEIRREALGERNVQTLTLMYQYGSFLSKIGRFEDADPLLYEVVEAGREVFDPEDITMAMVLAGLARNMVQLERLEEAVPLLIESIERGERTRPGHRENREALVLLADVYRRTGDAQAAQQTRQRLQSAD